MWWTFIATTWGKNRPRKPLVDGICVELNHLKSFSLMCGFDSFHWCPYICVPERNDWLVRSSYSPIRVGGVCVIWSSALKLGVKIGRGDHSFLEDQFTVSSWLFTVYLCALKAWQRGYKRTSNTSRNVFQQTVKHRTYAVCMTTLNLNRPVTLNIPPWSSMLSFFLFFRRQFFHF